MSTDPNVCRMTLVGPAHRDAKPKLLSLKLWSKPEWRRLVIEIRVGSDRWPNWDRANVCLTAIQDLLKINDGFLNDEVVNALQTHVDVVSYQTFNGPPNRV